MMKRLELRVPYRQEIEAPGKAIRFGGDGYAFWNRATDTRDEILEMIVVAQAENDGALLNLLWGGVDRIILYPDGVQIYIPCNSIDYLSFRNLRPNDYLWHTFRVVHHAYTGKLIFQVDSESYTLTVPSCERRYFTGLAIGAEGRPLSGSFVGNVDFVEIRIGGRRFRTYPIEEGEGDILHNEQNDPERNFTIVNGIWVNGKPYPPRLYQPFELEVEP